MKTRTRQLTAVPILHPLFAILAAGALAAGCATPPAPPSFPEVGALPAKPELPDPLVMMDGERVKSRDRKSTV
jgi:hypothetical protein